MTIDEICAAAWNGAIPSGLTIEQELFCLRMIRLYGRFKSGGINQDNATIEKAKEVKKYNDSVKLKEFDRKKSDHTVSMWRDMEGLVSAYRKNRTLEIADKLADATQGKVIDWQNIEKEETNETMQAQQRD